MRIAYVCADPGIPVFGCKGCSIHVQEVVREFLRRGAETDLFALRIGGQPPTELDRATVRQIPFRAERDAAEREAALVEANEALRELLERHGPYDLVYERHALFAHAGMAYAAQRRTPSVVEVNAPLIWEQQRYRGLVHAEAALATARRSLQDAGAVIAVSAPAAAYAAELRGSARDVVVQPNGVDPGRFARRSSAGSDDREITVGFVGTLKPWHGVDVLVRAFAAWLRGGGRGRLLIVGDGPERPKLERLRAEVLGEFEDRVVFWGAALPHVVPGLLAQMDVTAAPYPDAQDCYFSPLKVLEYMAASTAVVASAVGQAPDMIAHERSGLLVPPGDVHALAEALGRLADDAALRRRLGDAARAVVERHFTWRGVVDRILGLAAAQGEARTTPAAAPVHVRSVAAVRH